MRNGPRRLPSAFLAACLALAALLLALAASPAAAATGAAGTELPALDDLQGWHADQVVAAAVLPGFSALPSPRETAAFAAGRVAVGVVFLESDGSIDKDVEDWSRADALHPGDRRENTLAAIRRALDWWNLAGQAGSLELFIPEAGEPGAPRTVQTGYEPVKRTRADDARWRRQAMAKLGVSAPADGSALAEHSYADSLRRRGRADWAFVLYVVDSLRDGDGAFADGGIGYTRDLFGPYMVVTYDNGTYGFADLEAVVAHEIGHLFGALDEYAPPTAGYPSTGWLSAGYLGVRNANAVRGGTTDHLCLMRGGRQTLDAYRQRALCPSTIGQTGLRDKDGDGLPDVVDTSPRFRDGPQQTSPEGIRVAGTVRERPCRRGTTSFRSYFEHDISIKVPHDVRFRTDGGVWREVTAADGRFDDPAEDWVVATGPLEPGHHVLEVQATTGQAAAFTRDIWAGPTVVDLDLAADAGFTRRETTLTAGRPLSLHLRSSSSGSPVPYLPDVAVVRLSGDVVKGAKAAPTDRRGLWSGVSRPLRNAVYEARSPGYDVFGPAASAPLSVGVRFAVAAERSDGPFRPGDRVRVSGSLKPATAAVRIRLEESADGGATWHEAAHTRTSAASAFAMTYRCRARGSVLLRVRAEATTENLGNVRRLPGFTVR